MRPLHSTIDMDLCKLYLLRITRELLDNNHNDRNCRFFLLQYINISCRTKPPMPVQITVEPLASHCSHARCVQGLTPLYTVLQRLSNLSIWLLRSLAGLWDRQWTFQDSLHCVSSRVHLLQVLPDTIIWTIQQPEQHPTSRKLRSHWPSYSVRPLLDLYFEVDWIDQH